MEDSKPPEVVPPSFAKSVNLYILTHQLGSIWSLSDTLLNLNI